MGLPKPYYDRDRVTVYCDDARKILPHLSGITAVVTDPPYGYTFMGKSWDASIPAIWEPLLNACLPGSPLLAFGGTRTYHRLVCAIEDAGWEIRDCLAWIYGQGFPKSKDISKAIDDAAGAEREVVGENPCTKGRAFGQGHHEGWERPWMSDENASAKFITAPATPLAQRWNGWGTALKPAHEPICLAMKPLDGTFAQNAEKYGVAGLAIDRCRIDYESEADKAGATPQGECTARGGRLAGKAQGGGERATFERPEQKGRWPANILLDGSDEVLEVFPETTSGGGDKGNSKGSHGIFGRDAGRGFNHEYDADTGSAARFFYCAKADKAERGPGNNHPTVKPLALMSYLCKLVSMPGYTGTLLDPFAGSGSTLLVATRWFERVIGIEREEEHCETIVRRLESETALRFGS